MLGQTKKSGTMRHSAKLPKLNIQQQIDNQQIADRMNKKITFAKNPRHLGQTISYAEAFATSDFQSQSKFRVEPQQLFFSNYDTNHIYESELKLINLSRYIQRIKISPFKQKEFVLAGIKYPNEHSGDIAPGMAVTVSIRFRPQSLNDFQEQLLVIAGNGVIKVPIIAQRERCQIGWPQKIECGHCWVGDMIKKQVPLKNRGGDSQFNLIGASEGSNSYKLGFFKITPTKLIFDKNTEIKLQIQFLPEVKGNFKQKIKYKTNEGDQEEVEISLEGGAYSAQIVLEQLNGQKILQQRVNNNLYVEDSQLGKQSKTKLKIKNLAVVQVDYFWHYEARNITIDKNLGKMKPSQLLQFNIKVRPQQIVPEDIKLDLYLYNLPEKSLSGSVVSKNIDGKQAIQCLSINVKTKPVQSQVQVYPLYRRIVQPLYQNYEVNQFIKINNNSVVSRTFKIAKISQDQFLQASCAQKQGTLDPMSQKEIKICFNLTTLTSINKKAHFLVTFDNGQSCIFTLEGRSTYPQVFFSEQNLYYGLLKTFSLNKKTIVLKNIQKTPAEVKIINKHRFYELQFYDFYQFEDESCYKKRFNIYDSISRKEVTQPFIIAPESQVVLDCYLNVMGEESIEQSVIFQIKNGEQTIVNFTGQVQDVEMSMNRTTINMRQIYKGNTYNSNKFLSRELQIVNDGNHDCAFQIDSPQYEQCFIKIQPLKGIVSKGTAQRIDLFLEPIKTGDFQFNIKWKYFDDFKINPDLYIENNDRIWFNKDDGLKSMTKQKNLLISGKIKGMAMNYYLKDQAKAKKVKVKVDDGLQSVKLSNSSFQASTLRGSQKMHENQKLVYPILQQLNFYNCEVNQVRQVQILIENDSGLSTQYEIYAENYHTLQKPADTERKNIRGLIKIEQEPFSSQMGRTFIRNRALYRSQKIHLGNNKGISILCEPACGVLHKKQTQKIMITMFNDTSGRFKDNLLICVKNHETKKIPVDMHIKGTPVALSRNQLGIDFNQEIPFMNLGTIIHSNGLVKKSIKVINNGPKQVALKWSVYPYNKVNNNKNIFNIQIEEATAGSGNIVELKWNALKPDIDKQSFFSIQPRERKLKGRQEFTFTVLIQEIKQIGEFANLCICQPTLIDNGRNTQMDQLAVVVKTQTIQPVLTMDVEHKNNINMLERFATTHEQFQTDTNNFVRLLKLKNNLKTNLTFDLSVINKQAQHQYFKLIQTKTNSPATTFSSTAKQIQTSFVITSGSILEVKVELTGNPSQLNHWPMQQKIRREGAVLLSYSNGQQQIINLTGWLYRPWVQLQMPNNQLHSPQNFQIDFGTVHINNSKKQFLYLINPSRVDGKWSISYVKYHQSIKYKFQQALWTNLDYEDQTIHDQKKCWRLSTDGGVVKNRSLPVHFMPNTLALPGQDDHYAETHKPTQLQIMFKPQANVLYKSKFRLTVLEGQSFDIVLKGRGTYEEELEK